MRISSLIRFFLLLLTLSLEAFQVRLTDDLPSEIRGGQIIRVDVLLENNSTEPLHVNMAIDSDPALTPLINGSVLYLEAQSQEMRSFYFRVSPTILKGNHSVRFRFYNQHQYAEVTKQFLVIPVTKISLEKLRFEKKKVILKVHNDSNYPIFFLNETIAPYSEKEIPFTFRQHIRKNFYSEKIPVYSDTKEEIKTFFVSAYVQDLPEDVLSNTEFNYPIQAGIAYSGSQSRNSLTIYAKGGGPFAKDQSLKFSVSAPFYHGTDPFLFYDPATSIFLFEYRYRDLNLLAGDAYFNNGQILYYRYGRGYTAEYNDRDRFAIKAGYVTKNKLYQQKEKDLIFSFESASSPKVYYKSFYDFNQYNQNLGLQLQSALPAKPFSATVELYNTDFHFEKPYLGFLGKGLYAHDTYQVNGVIDYLGPSFQGRTNAEFKVAGTVKKKWPRFKVDTSLFCSFLETFPEDTPLVKAVHAKGSISKIFSGGYNSLNLDYTTYDNQSYDRENYSLYYHYNQRFRSSLFLNFNQGFTYTDLHSNQTQNTMRSYTKLLLNYHLNRWNFSLGGFSQVRYFSDSLKSENSLFFGLKYQHRYHSLFLNFNFSNTTFVYRPYVNFNYKTRFSLFDMELDYQLIPVTTGYNWRALAKFNVLKYLRIKKPTDLITKVYDKNTNLPIPDFYARLENGRSAHVVEGTIADRVTADDLEMIDFLGFETEKKFKTAVTKESIQKEYTFRVNYLGKVIGMVQIESAYPRKSIHQKILEQRIFARNDSGQLFPGSIYADGSFSIQGLPVGRYEIFIDEADLPSLVQTTKKQISIDYQESVYSIDLKATY